LADLTTKATDEQIEAKESKIIEFEKREYLAQHIILSTTSTRLGAKIKDMTSAQDMWKAVKEDATTKSTLHLLDAEEQLQSMKLHDNEDSKAHLTEIKQHFQLMIQRRDSLTKMAMSDTRFNIIIMSSLPDSYRPTLQTITAAERASKLSGSQVQQMKPDDHRGSPAPCRAAHRTVTAVGRSDTAVFLSTVRYGLMPYRTISRRIRLGRLPEITRP
jgi:hypothetical protein